MKLRLIFTVLIILAAVPAWAAFKDVPAGHWSSMAVYNLVSQGITQGYPDGTFRGDKIVSRYEVAAFLSKLDRITKYNMAISEKLIGELRVELEKVKKELNAFNHPSEEVAKFSGNLWMRTRSGMEQSQEGATLKTDYRFTSSFSKRFGDDFTVKLSMDTLDAGFGGGERELATSMLGIEGKAKIAVLGLLGDLEVKVGPGLIFHRELKSFQADDYMVFSKPYNSVAFSTRLKGYYLSTFYVARTLTEFGNPYSNEIGATIGFPKFKLPVLNDVEVFLTPRYLFKDPELPTFESHDLRGEIEFRTLPSPKIEGTLLLGMGGASSDDRHYINLKMALNDYFNTGTYFKLSVHKVGADYRVPKLDKYEFGLLNMFDKLILDGTADIGLELSQKITDSSKIYIKGDVVLDEDLGYGAEYEGSSLTLEEGVIFYIPSGMILKLLYKTYDVPSGIADAADPENFKRAVPKSSNILSASITYNF